MTAADLDLYLHALDKKRLDYSIGKRLGWLTAQYADKQLKRIDRMVVAALDRYYNQSNQPV